MEYEIWDLAGSRTVGAKTNDVPDNFPKPCELSDSDLWELCLLPRKWGMSKKTLDYLDEVEKKFHKRKIKLVPIMDCSFGRPDYNRFGEKIKANA